MVEEAQIRPSELEHQGVLKHYNHGLVGGAGRSFRRLFIQKNLHGTEQNIVPGSSSSPAVLGPRLEH